MPTSPSATPSTLPPAPLPGIGAILAVSSAKGGVGKSTVTVNLAAALQRMGKRVGILDADILGPSVPGMLGITMDEPPKPGTNGRITPPEGHGIKVVSMAMFSGDDQPMMLRGPMVGKYLNLFLAGVDWGTLDLLLIDMPPGTGDIQLNIAQSFPLSGAIIVTTPQAVSTRIARRGARMFETVRTPVLGVVENMRTFTCPTCGTTHDLFGHGGGERLAADLGLPFLGALPLDPTVLDAGDEGVPLAAGPEGGDSCAGYAALARAIDQALVRQAAALAPFRLDWASGQGAPGWNEERAADGGDPSLPVGLRKTDERTLSILWQDGRRQDIDVRDLRLSCGCALCRDEMTGRPLLDPAALPQDVRPVEVHSVGRYALGLSWSDGHASGIHPFAAIAALPPADRCPADGGSDASSGTPAPAREPDDVLSAVQHVLDSSFNAQIARHGGHVRLIGFDEGKLEVELEGRCQGCAASQMTLRRGLASALRLAVPEVREIIDVTDHQSGRDPYFPQ